MTFICLVNVPEFCFGGGGGFIFVWKWRIFLCLLKEKVEFSKCKMPIFLWTKMDYEANAALLE